MRSRLLGATCIVASVATACALWRALLRPPVHRPVFDESMLGASVGDVVFFCTTTWRGRLIRLLGDVDDEFTHVGVIARSDQHGLHVVHASPVEGSTVRMDRLVDLLSRREISCAAIYHPRVSESEALRAASIARSYANTRTPFDHEFRLEDDHAVYCTELVWLSYRNAGLRIHRTGSIVFPSDLIHSGFFRPGARTSNRSRGNVSFRE